MATMKMIQLHAAVDKAKQFTLQLEGGMRRVAQGTLSMTVMVRILTSSTVVKRIKTPNGIARPLARKIPSDAPRYCDSNSGDPDLSSRLSTATSQGTGKTSSLSAAPFSDRVRLQTGLRDSQTTQRGQD